MLVTKTEITQYWTEHPEKAALYKAVFEFVPKDDVDAFAERFEIDEWDIVLAKKYLWEDLVSSEDDVSRKTNVGKIILIMFCPKYGVYRITEFCDNWTDDVVEVPASWAKILIGSGLDKLNIYRTTTKERFDITNT